MKDKIRFATLIYLELLKETNFHYTLISPQTKQLSIGQDEQESQNSRPKGLYVYVNPVNPVQLILRAQYAGKPSRAIWPLRKE